MLPSPQPDGACVITGASSGIGADFARELAGRGHNLVLVARREDRLRELAAELTGGADIRVENLTCDLAEPAERDALPDRVEALGLRIDVLVNNAGFGSSGSLHEIDRATEVRMVRVNCEAVVALTTAVLPDMVARRAGAILNVASVVAFQPVPLQATYSASKAFVLAFTEALHAEVSGAGVSVTALCPGVTRTEFFDTGEITMGRMVAASAMDPAAVAAAGIRGLEAGRRVVIPGAVNRINAVGGRHTPRSLLLPLLKRIKPVQ